VLFCTKEFLVFFLLVAGFYWGVPRHRWRVWLLVVASFYFYASWNAWLAVVICISTAVDYAVARLMETSRHEPTRKALLVTSLVMNLGLLASFKYANFFLASFRGLLAGLGSAVAVPTFEQVLNGAIARLNVVLGAGDQRLALSPIEHVILPVGISFYTFEAINYTVDVYRRRIPAERNLGHFMLFITFFPHLVAGPIVRARDFLPQIRRRKRWSWPRLQLGVEYFLMGMLKKAVADRLALLVDPVFAHGADGTLGAVGYSTGMVWIAVLAYSIQIYFDFSGYTDMALGTAHALGFKLARNFDLPYISRNVSEFWRRWHISLSTWLRDYLFIPLGGSRGTSRETDRNLLLTMMLGGLWHGASWTFVAWGTLHGVYLVVHRRFVAFCEVRPRLTAFLDRPFGTALRGAVTFLTVSLTWVFFRAQSFADARVIFTRLLLPRSGWGAPPAAEILWVTLVVGAVCHLIAARRLTRPIFARVPPVLLGLGYSFVLITALVLTLEENKAFIYFQF
jgi:alginate O-acetyltransferase complex protein AlgI